ncbi:HVO_0649 family zinc finger protein [Halorubrum amylolyticum]|uniref:HVO_0649 family zinc finger protein n=1 Tax=Halorubrum amylolyticum TaxID=2508724 RepID=UPI001008BDBC|nr:HVO_0649 family zinc finger protein [Halorubrum amylolyticum]
MSSSYGGTSAFDRLRARLDGRSRACEECGFVDEEGAWEAVTTGATVEYHRECPSCGTERVRRYRL